MLSGRQTSRPWRHVLVASGIMLATLLLLRFATSIAEKDLTWDERFMQPVVEAIVIDGWKSGNTIDYEDTKGPAFFWIYAAWGELFGPDIDALRALSMVMLVLTGIPLGLIAARCGMTLSETGLSAIIYALLPYNAVLAELFMSEPSFMLGCLLLALIFIWGFGTAADTLRHAAQKPCGNGGHGSHCELGPSPGHRAAGPILFGIVLALLLHHRPHAIAYAGAAVLVAAQRDGWRSWPWWAAAGVAGVMRIPLYLRWGGLVTPEYQQRMGLGLQLDNLTYVAIALLPATVVLLWPVITQPTWRHRRWWVVIGGLIGLVLGAIAVPDLSLTVDAGRARYMGITASALRWIDEGLLYRLAVIALSTAGAASLGAVAALTLDVRAPRGRTELVHRLAGLVLLIGWLAHVASRGAVFDRYVLPFIALLPLVLVREVPRWLLVVQALVLTVILVTLSRAWLL